MNGADVLVDGFGRVRDLVHHVVDGLGPDRLAFRLDGEANSIAWLVWHLTRIQDDHVADASQTEQAWLARGWADRFGLPLSRSDTGFGHSPEQVAALDGTSAELLTAYHDAVHEHTEQYVSGLGDDDLARVIDTSWDPPVTLGVRLVSVVDDNAQHAGQAAFVRGIVQRSSRR